MNTTTLNPSNAKYLSDYITSYIFETASKDKMLSQIFSLPEFSQPLAQGINQFFQNYASQNIEIDLDKLSNLNQSFDNILPKSNEEADNFYDDEENDSNDFIEFSSGNRNAHLDKNIRTAQWYKDILLKLVPIVRNKLGPLLGSISIVGPFFETLLNFILNFVEELIHNIERAILQITDPDFWKELVLSYNAYDAITEAKRSEMYSIGAYEHMLENKTPTGYGGKLHSQGFYNAPSPEMKRQFSEQVVQNPDIVNSRFKDDPNLGPRIKKNLNQLVASDNKKFVKVAQQEMSEISQRDLQELQKVMPSWNMNTVLKEVYAVYSSPDLPAEQKQQAVEATITKYMRAAQPLYKFLKDNKFPTPDTAQ